MFELTPTPSVPIYNLFDIFEPSLTGSYYSTFCKKKKIEKIKAMLKVYYMLNDITLKIVIVMNFFNEMRWSNLE